MIGLLPSGGQVPPNTPTLATVSAVLGFVGSQNLATVIVDGASQTVTCVCPIGYAATIGDRLLVQRIGSQVYCLSVVAAAALFGILARGVASVSASGQVAGSISGAATITFPFTFPSVPNVWVCLQAGTTGSASATHRASAVTTTGFVIAQANTHPTSAMTFAATPCSWWATL